MGIKLAARKNSSAMKKCAFCKHWYDPMNTVIAPKKGMKDTWEYETQIKNVCLINNNMERMSHSSCFKFESKI